MLAWAGERLEDAASWLAVGGEGSLGGTVLSPVVSAKLQATCGVAGTQQRDEQRQPSAAATRAAPRIATCLSA